MRSILWAIAAAALVLGGSTITSAQGMGAGEAARAYKAPKTAPRAKRYYYSSGYKTCGQFRYWKGGKCLDARTNPPTLK